jgi:hypothetical protein
MSRNQKQVLALVSTSVLVATVLLLAGMSEAVKPDKPNPDDPVMTMLDEIYDIVLDTNSKVSPAGIPVTKTGQTISYVTGDDGDLEKGADLPDPRFTDNGNGTVTDNLTGLMWTKDAQQIAGEMDWYDAIDACNNLVFAGWEDWRLPNVREMLSLIDYGYYNPALTPGHPFINVPQYPGRYWVSTTMANNSLEAMHVPIVNGAVNGMNKINNIRFVWPVRGGS